MLGLLFPFGVEGWVLGLVVPFGGVAGCVRGLLFPFGVAGFVLGLP